MLNVVKGGINIGNYIGDKNSNKLTKLNGKII